MLTIRTRIYCNRSYRQPLADAVETKGNRMKKGGRPSFRQGCRNPASKDGKLRDTLSPQVPKYIKPQADKLLESNTCTNVELPSMALDAFGTSLSRTLRAAKPCKSAILPICPAIPSEMTAFPACPELCITTRAPACAGSQAPAWEPLPYKLLLDPTPESRASQTVFPNRKYRPYTQVPSNQKCRHSGRDCRNLEAMEGKLVAEQVFYSDNLQPAVSHPCGLDSGNPCRNDGSATLAYNDESRSLGMGKKSHGFTLIELMVALTIMAITATILIKSTSGLQDQGRYNQTVDRVNQIKQAIVNVQTVNGVPQVSGFVADMGRLPYCVHELLTNNSPCNGSNDLPWGVIGFCGATTTYTTLANCTSGWSSLTNPLPNTMGAFWNGPYLQTSNSPTQSYAFTDGWGNDYAFPSIMSASTSCSTPYSLISFPDNQSNCAELDNYNYGWRFDYYDPPNQTSTTNYLLNLQSYGSDGLPDTIDTNASAYQTDYPADANQPVIHLQDWLFNLGFVATTLNSGSTQQLQPTSVTINLTHTNPSPFSFSASKSTDIQTVCNIVGGTGSSSSSAYNCTMNQTLCATMGGSWNPSSGTGTCTLTQQPLQSLCTGGSANGTWSNANGGQCTLTSLSATNCGLLNNTTYVSYSNSCTFPPSSTLPILSTTCTNFSGTWSGSTCSLTNGTTIFSNTSGISGISDFCSAIGGYWNISASTCFIAAPLLPLTPPAFISNICLNIFYRNITASTITPIVVATSTATVTNDGQPHVVNFSNFSVYDLNATALSTTALVPVGQNAISVTSLDNNGVCSGPVGTGVVTYPANHSSSPIPQTFLPGQPLIFNW